MLDSVKELLSRLGPSDTNLHITFTNGGGESTHVTSHVITKDGHVTQNPGQVISKDGHVTQEPSHVIPQDGGPNIARWDKCLHFSHLKLN